MKPTTTTQLLFTFTLLFLMTLSLPAEEKKLSVYFIGNSLTASTTLDRVHALFAQRGIDLEMGSQLSGGKSLMRHWNYKEEPKQKWISWETNVPAGNGFTMDKNPYDGKPEPRFGRYDTALVEHKWDIVVMQTYGSYLGEDFQAICNFIDLALKNGSADKFYIYAPWPPRKKEKGTKKVLNFDYAGHWTAPYETEPSDSAWQTKKKATSRHYFERLLSMLNEKYPDLKQPIRIIPAGEVLFEVDAMIRADQVPGMKELAKRDPALLPGLDEDTTFADGINVLYADGIHLNPIPHKTNAVGIFLSGTTIFTVLSGENPVGLSGEPYGLAAKEDELLVKALQETIWKVVTSDPRTGVKP